MTSPTGGGPALAATRDALHRRVMEGRYPSSGRLPAERALARELGVSRTTLRLALAALEDQGLVASAPQSGWFATQARLSEPPQALMSFTEMARRRGIEPTTAVVVHRVREASYDEAERLKTHPLTPVLHVERIRSLAGIAACYDTSVISLGRVPGLEKVELTDRSLYAEMTKLGVRPTRSDFAVEASGATQRTSHLLGVRRGSPVLVGEETCSDQVGRHVLLGRSIFRANAYRFYATLLRR